MVGRGLFGAEKEAAVGRDGEYFVAGLGLGLGREVDVVEGGAGDWVVLGGGEANFLGVSGGLEEVVQDEDVEEDEEQEWDEWVDDSVDPGPDDHHEGGEEGRRWLALVCLEWRKRLWESVRLGRESLQMKKQVGIGEWEFENWEIGWLENYKMIIKNERLKIGKILG